MAGKGIKKSDHKVKMHMMSATNELLKAANEVFSIYKSKRADDNKNSNLANLFEKGIFITEELQKGLLSFIDKIEEESVRDHKLSMGEKNDER